MDVDSQIEFDTAESVMLRSSKEPRASLTF